MKKELLTKREASRKLGVSPWLVGKAIESGQLPGVQLGARWMVPVAALSEWLTNARNGSEATATCK